MLNQSIRTLAFGFGALLFLGGVADASLGGPEAASGVIAIAFGSAVMVVGVLQRSRYRSNEAERSDNAAPGPEAARAIQWSRVSCPRTRFSGIQPAVA